MSAELKETVRGATKRTFSWTYVTGVVNSSGWSNVPITWVDSRVGVKNPNWRRQVSRAQNATTMLDGSKMTLEHDGACHYLIAYQNRPFQPPANQVTYREKVGDICDLPAPDSPAGISINAANDKALSRLIKKAREAQTTFQGGVALGELAETLRMIRNPAKAFRRGLDDYMEAVKKRLSRRRQGYPRNLSRSKRNARDNAIIANSWLEYSFGWTPLLSDVDSAAKALAQRQHEFRRETQEVRAYEKVESYSMPFYNFFAEGLMDYEWRGQLIAVAEVTYYGAVKREVVNDRAVSTQIFGFRPKDVLPTIWEVIPYSFLVDYFTNIGDIVSAFSFHMSNFAWLARTERRTYVYEIRDQRFKYAEALAWVKTNNRILQNASNVNNTWKWTRSLVHRAPYSGSLIPDLTFEIPGSSTKWMNLGALGFNHRKLLSFIHR